MKAYPRTCQTCGRGCVGRVCRACYTKAPRKSIWRHEWAYIYELHDPDSGQVRYVGCSEHPGVRLTLHVHNAWKERSPKDLWIRTLLRAGKRPVLKVVKKVSYAQRLEEEQRHIRVLLDAGADLLNVVVRGTKWWHRVRAPGSHSISSPRGN
ncbi:hypothetical protein KSF_106390 [Reticulibacter mediterranei]|uniref:GIY-YIG domain-containing protein n=1 Tax=Reticulibacter mediterranei TaxID=2778369 RepID=A0A8J3J2Z0_9CHLR|nr:hypothetical protein [Reticulibacter mediterranei]GHP00592.1 hypothetical protein KSF_106390 [Reticulibacter mediterranei]